MPGRNVCICASSQLGIDLTKEKMMVQLRFAAFLVLIMTCPTLGIAQSPPASYICNFAKVKVRSEKTSVLVRSGPGNNFRIVGRLQPGQEVYICDEDGGLYDGGWYNVYYSGPDGPCGPMSENGLDSQKAKGCQSGWVEKKWINVISG